MKVSNEVKFLEDAFDVLNEKYFENTLSKCAITIQSSPTTHGHFTPYDAWSDSEKNYNEINLGAESLKRHISEIIATLIHEAENRGLVIGYDSRIGYSETTPSDELKEFCAKMGWEEKIKLYRRLNFNPEQSVAKSKSSTRKYQCPCCGMSVRATKEVNILCMDCNQQLELVE